ncbi:tyrosyl-DNA phosphodiesterase 2 isoform X2 [Biomphalaria pfeifferi]|uniref:Tyrosyl-DNA phosphodiesterase 2 n=1 Tax=Biomphalaria pfeifferi TaxID=112525 RepID=A0AAD8AP71_BIOPF|nr:tyrosyl-DNA phosphodiesterase 2 isoform X2 [Biomphalaria pfeifferi]
MSDIVYVSDSQSDEDDINLPSKDECEERCQQFAEITGTDSALAMFYLQDRDWSVERALSDFFSDNQVSENQQKLSSKKQEKHSNELAVTGARKATTDGQLSKVSGMESFTQRNSLSCPTTFPPIKQTSHVNRLCLLSWNIDGLDPDNLVSRTEGACSMLLHENPEIIFLQEIVSTSLQIIKAHCVNYEIFLGLEGDKPAPDSYFTAILLRKDCTSVERVTLAEFPESRMSRNLLECSVKSIPMTLLTSHLESTAEYTSERKSQLSQAFSRMKSIDKNRVVLFGGDLNLRDKELTGSSALPEGVIDIWEYSGKRAQARYTWDLTINDNKQMSAKFQPRCRFDRVYMRNSVPALLNPVYFELAGIQRLSSCQRFPSDHWGILCHFDIK